MSTFPWKEWIPGALNDQQLGELIGLGFIENAGGDSPDYSSFDLRLDDEGYEMVQGSVKPQGGGYEQFLRASRALLAAFSSTAIRPQCLSRRRPMFSS